MSRVHIDFLDQQFHRVLFDAMPVPVFVVDEDVCVLDYNVAAGRVIGKDRRLVIQRRCGEVLNCVHCNEAPGGCGRAADCPKCGVRKSVKAASQGRRVTRRRAKMDLIAKGKQTRVDLQVSCQMFTYGQHSYFLLILEGLDG